MTKNIEEATHPQTIEDLEGQMIVLGEEEACQAKERYNELLVEVN